MESIKCGLVYGDLHASEAPRVLVAEAMCLRDMCRMSEASWVRQSMAVERSGRVGGSRCKGPVNGCREVVSVERVSRNERTPGDWLVLRKDLARDQHPNRMADEVAGAQLATV